MQGMLFVQSLVDDYIVPLLQAEQPDFTPLANALSGIVVFYIIGVAAAYAYNRIMVNISQGTMRKFRNELFENMESLPIKYFDTHAHGDIMSIYTNDIDTLRQLFGQSIPQMINSAATLIATLISMIVLNIPLTIISVLMSLFMLKATKILSSLSGKYYQKQQEDIGSVDGYIEEMMDGQKVVKVFCHEETAIRDFKKLNDRLRDSSNKANRYANLLMPINANIGNLSYVFCAVIGALLALPAGSTVTVGTVIAFVGLNKNFNQPITQISQQMNFVVMAAAGAARVFELLDEKPEVDNGYVELVNAVEDPDGLIRGTKQRTGMWAWKHPHKADATDEECIAAAKLANADGFIRRLPDGYETILSGDGGNLSQGQRQLIAIARAAVADPPVLILDEATSSIDTRTEALVQEGMDQLMKGRTTFVIAHRLSTIRNADCIMVMEQGRIIERGTHDQLIEKKGKYYQLYTGNAVHA